VSQGAHQQLLTTHTTRRALTDEFHRHEATFHRLHAYVVMPNHAHVLVTPLAPNTWQSIVSAWRRRSAATLIRDHGWTAPVWQDECFDRIVRNWTEFLRYRAYILRNPGNMAAGTHAVWSAELPRGR
jgi:REP element-mobilizing transposase RayT